MSTIYDDASLILYPSGYKASKLYSLKPTNGTGDLDVVRATTATRVNSDGLIEEVAINVPRIDYTGGGCGKLLLEPAATNLVLRSEEFDNAYWLKTEVTVTANTSSSPDGATTADKLIPSIVNTGHFIGSGNFSFTSGTTYTFSVFGKASGYNHLRLAFSPNAFPSDQRGASFNLETGTVGDTQSGVTARIQTLPNGFYRCSITATATVTATSIGGATFINSQNADSAITVSFAGDGTSGAFIWGAQLEEGSYPTSYIKTEANQVTRNADVISKTGISSLIGQSEGTIYVEVNINNSVNGTISTIDDGSANNFISLSKLANRSVRVNIRGGGGAFPAIITTSILSIGRHKIALNYKNGDYTVYVDGVLEGTSTNSTDYPVSTLSRFSLSNPSYGFFNDSYNSAVLFKTRLTNDELAALTTL